MSPSVRRLAALALCTIAFGAACFGNSTSAPAAKVNGTSIPTKELVDELNAINANPDFIRSLEAGSPNSSGAATSTGLTVVGSTPGTFDAAFVSQVLLRQIDYALIHAEVTRRQLALTDACRLTASNDAKLNLGQGNADTGQTLFEKFPKAYQDLLIQRTGDVIVLEAALSGQDCGSAVDAEGYYNAHQADFTKLCISLIAVNDQATADSVVAQARAGTDFAALATQFSVDPTSQAAGGAVGCRLPSEFNPTIAQLLQAAKTGDVLDPIPASTGFSIVKVTDRQLASLDEVRSQAEELATSSQGQAFGNWLRDARAHATVVVDARYGTFDPATFSISPPALEAGSNAPSSTTTSTSIPTQSSSTDAP